MRARALFRRLHLAGTAILGVQLVVWTGTGLAFTLANFDDVRSTRVRAAPPALVLKPGAEPGALTVVGALEKARALAGDADVTGVRLGMLGGEPTYTVAFRGGDPVFVRAQERTGEREGGAAKRGLSDDEARRVAEEAYAGPGQATAPTRLSREGEEPEMPLPAVRTCFSDAARTCVYVSPATGEVLGFRNDSWRTFDTFFSLHVMGYVSRSSPAHAPLRIASGIAFLASVSGLLLLVFLLVARFRHFFRKPRGGRARLPPLETRT